MIDDFDDPETTLGSTGRVEIERMFGNTGVASDFLSLLDPNSGGTSPWSTVQSSNPVANLYVCRTLTGYDARLRSAGIETNHDGSVVLKTETPTGYDVSFTSAGMVTNYDGSVVLKTGTLTGYNAGITSAGIETNYDGSVALKVGALTGHNAGITSAGIETNYDGSVVLKVGALTGHNSGVTSANMLTNYDGSIGVKMGTLSAYNAGITSASVLANYDGSVGIKVGALTAYDAGITSANMLTNSDGSVGIKVGTLTGYNAGITSKGVLAGHHAIGGVDLGIKANCACESFNLRSSFGRIQNSLGDFDPTLSVGGWRALVTTDQPLCDNMLATAGLSVKSPLNVIAGTSLGAESAFGALSFNQVDITFPIANTTRDIFASSNEQHLVAWRTNVLTTARPLYLGPTVNYYGTTILSSQITAANDTTYRHAEVQIRQQQFSVKLPLQFNDGKDVPAEWIEEAKLELTDLFGGVSYVEGGGLWKNEGVVFPNTWIWIMVEVPDLDRNRRLMKQFKEQWGPRLGQIDLRVTSQEVKIL